MGDVACISSSSEQPLFIRMNQRGNKAGAVTRQGYEIRTLIEFCSAAACIGALNIIGFDRIMKGIPTPAQAAASKKGAASTTCILRDTWIFFFFSQSYISKDRIFPTCHSVFVYTLHLIKCAGIRRLESGAF